MNWLIFGAGALGTYIGGSLELATQSGEARQQVVFLERPEVAEGIRQRGLRLIFEGRERRVATPQVVGSLPEALAQGPFDAGIFALKSYDTQSALKELAPRAGDLPPLLCLQNGVENEVILNAALGMGKVIAGTVTSSIGRVAAGDIVLEKRRGLGIADGHPLSFHLVQALQEAGLETRLYPHPAAMKWSKMLTNLLANATSAILDMTPVEVFANPDLCRLETIQIREALAVMKALGIGVVNLPGVPVSLLALGVRFLPLALIRPMLQRLVGGGRGAKMPSLHIDLHGGRVQSEVDYLNGAVVRYGSQAGIPTPVNRLLNETLLALLEGRLSLEAFRRQPEKLLSQL